MSIWIQKKPFRLALLLVLLSMVAGCTSAPLPQENVDTANVNTVYERADGLTITNPVAQEAPLEGGNGAVYLTIRSGRDDQLIGAESSAAAMVELHESWDDNGVMRMEPRPEGFEMTAGDDVALKQGGKHIMLMNLAAPLADGDEIEVTLNFRKQAPVTITVPVVAMGDMHKHR